MRHDTQWRSEYAIGVADVDHQHRHLMHLLGRAVELAATSHTKRLQRLLGEVEAYAADNFRTEEHLMRASRLPPAHVRLHIAAHSTFWRDLDRLEGRLQDGDDAVAPALEQFLQRWLAGHICGMDREMGHLLR